MTMLRPTIGFLVRCWVLFLLPFVMMVPGLTILILLIYALVVTMSSRLIAGPLFLGLIIIAMVLLIRAFRSPRFRERWKATFWIWRFARRVLEYRKVSMNQGSILYPAHLEGKIDLEELAGWTKTDLEDLSDRFGFRLRRVTIVLIPDHHQLSADIGRQAAGFAMPGFGAVALAMNFPLRGILRHELVHLFANRWNSLPSPINQEGIAVWLERHDQGPGFGRKTEARIPTCWPEVSRLLDKGFFFSTEEVSRSYEVAGVFTGFLIRRYGWKRYRRFYRTVHRWSSIRSFKKHFARQFGLSLEEAWRRCPDEALAMATLTRKIGEDGLFHFRL